jgi:hypothetical protein
VLERITCLLIAVTWGLTRDGEFFADDDTTTATMSVPGRLWRKLTDFVGLKRRHISVEQNVRSELKKVHDSVLREQVEFNKKTMSERNKNKRLLYLFQYDLMPGITGEILELKDRRDNRSVNATVSRSAKLIAWIYLLVLNGAMLFYIFLFAVSQDHHRQQAWANSFATWLVMEVLVVSSVMVLFMNVLLPWLTMKDIKIVQMRLMQSLQVYQQRERSALDGAVQDSWKFNAADVLFVSLKLAKNVPELRVAKMISTYSTPWPKQSFQRVTNLSQQYTNKFGALYGSAATIVMFFVTSFLSFPPTLQDLVMHMCTSAVTGYVVLVHLQLFQIFPVLVVVPMIVLFSIFYVLAQSQHAKHPFQLELMTKSTLPVVDVMTPESAEDRKGDTPLDRRGSILQGIDIANKAKVELESNSEFFQAAIEPGTTNDGSDISLDDEVDEFDFMSISSSSIGSLESFS